MEREDEAMSKESGDPLRHLVVVLGDQLDERSAALDGFDPQGDAVWIAEVADEARHVWSNEAAVLHAVDPSNVSHKLK